MRRRRTVLTSVPPQRIRCVLAASLLYLLCGCSQARPSVTIDDATYTGRWQLDGQVAAFLGLPYAAPPTGADRWQAPRPPAVSGERDAGAFAPACMQGPHMLDWYAGLIRDFGAEPAQFPRPAFSEDCLYLNVWTPALRPARALPVMVWIHGGSHRGGWAYEPNYVGDRLAARGVVVVSIAYRLDVFGFFSHPELPVSNFGLLDQLAALAWVRDHASHFGGDPQNVTVFGESAGAASAGYLLVSPLQDSLFRRVIHQSAGYEFRHRDRREDFLEEGRAIEQRVLGDVSGIDALRRAPAAALLAAAEAVYTDYRPDAVVDGHSLVEPPVDSLRAGRVAPADLLIGSNADEWKMYLGEDSTAADVDAWLATHAGSAADALRTALAGDETPRRSLDRLYTADQFVCPSLALANRVADAGGRAWVYYFDRVRPGRHAAELGAYHGAEIPYVFDTHDDWLPGDATDRELGAAMAAYWTQFAIAGDPNVGGLPYWPRWRAADDQVLTIGMPLSSGPHPERGLCELVQVTERGTE